MLNRKLFNNLLEHLRGIILKHSEFIAQYEYSHVPYDATQGHPMGSEMFYECMSCHDVFPSLPKDSIICSCRNFYIDVDYGRLGSRDGDNSFRLLSASPKKA
jgi:hypothetical protein